MDYPKSVANVGLVNGKFIDEDTATGTVGSLIPAEWGNGVTDEILAVIQAGGLTPSEENNAQLLAALKQIVVGGGVTPGRLIGVQVFITSGVYTPTSGTKSIIVELVGGGGGSGGTAATGTSTIAQSIGGGGGAYAKSRLTSGFAGQSVTVGAPGAGGAAGNNNGAVGGASSFGSLVVAPGGSLGAGSAAISPVAMVANGGNSAEPTGANLIGKAGEAATSAFAYTTLGSLSSKGGGSPFGTGGHMPSGSGFRAPSGYGAGPSGVYAQNSATAQAGGNGAPGLVLIYEYA